MKPQLAYLIGSFVGAFCVIVPIACWKPRDVMVCAGAAGVVAAVAFLPVAVAMLLGGAR